MKKLLLFLPLCLLGVYYAPLLAQEESEDPDLGYEWCQFINRPDRPEIDGCKIAYFNHICPCE